MTATCRTSTRPATESERSRLVSGARGQALSSCGCILLPCAGVGFLAGSIAGWASDVPRIGLYVGGAIGVLLFVWWGWDLWKFSAPLDRLIRADAEAGIIEVLDIETDAAVELPVEHSSVDPTYLFDIGGNRLLLLVGQWQYDPAKFETSGETATDDPVEWFPSTRFVLSRWPTSGQVLSIRVTGELLEVNEVDCGVDRRRLWPADSRLIDGSLDDVDGALEAAVERQPPAQGSG